MHGTPESGADARPVHVFQQVMDGHHIGARQPARQPEQMRNMDKIAAQTAYRRVALKISSESVRPCHGDGCEVLRKLSDFAYFFWSTQQKIFVLPIQPSECADDVACVRTNAKLVHPANVDGDLHRENLTTADAPRLRSRK